MSEVIIRLNSDHIKVKGAEYVQDLVRCRECKHASDNNVYGCMCNHFNDNDWDYHRMYADDFCSRAERREP